ncbi:MAG: hypothetical protein ACXV8O_13560 [Methylobacter sp.]
MNLIRINKNTSINDISEWLGNIDNVVTFEILNKSSFQLFAEGVALGVLRKLSVNRVTINIQFYKTPDLSNEIDQFHPSLFKSIFGLELLRLSKSIYNKNGDQLDIRSIIGKKLWEHVLKQKGHLGDGKKAYLISRHDYEIPRCLRENEFSNSFPRYDYFQSSVSSYLLKLRGYTKAIEESERKLIEWLHHIAENAYEHGRYSFLEKDIVDGFKGIVLGKYFCKDISELYKRDEFPGFVKQFISRLIDTGEYKLDNFIINYASVMDTGDGIQNTLNISNQDTEFNRLCLAFKDGVTRKTELMNEKSGYGLGQAINAANDLNALLHIVSGNIQTSIDFSNSNIDQKIDNLSLSDPVLLPDKFGVSISLLWLSKQPTRKVSK